MDTTIRFDRRGFGYGAVAVVAMFAALTTGRLGGLIVATPFMVMLVYGLSDLTRHRITASSEVESPNVLIGDTVHFKVVVERPRHHLTSVELHLRGGLTTDSATTGRWDLKPFSNASVVGAAVAERMGRFELGTAFIRSSRPGSLLLHVTRVKLTTEVRVLPPIAATKQMFSRPGVRAAPGVHRSKWLGSGSDFEEISPMQVGDRLRDINWWATARRREPYVNRFRVDRTADVMMVLDATLVRDLDDVAASRALELCAGAVWTIASSHLLAVDRVGLVIRGRLSTWIRPATGRLAQHRLLEALLSLGPDAIRRTSNDPDVLDALRGSLTVVCTSLWDEHSLGTVTRVMSRGNRPLVVALDATAVLGEPTTDAECLAQRVIRLRSDTRARRLAQHGIDPVRWTGEEDLAGALAHLERRNRRRPMVGS